MDEVDFAATVASIDIDTVFFLVVLIMMSAFFSATETAFTGLNRSRLKTMANMGDDRAIRTLKMANSYDTLLSTILIGNNIVNILATSLATALFTSLFPENGIVIATAVMTVVVLIFGEITPKSLAKEMPLRLALTVTPPLRVLFILLYPLNILFSLWRKLVNKIFKPVDDNAVTDEELLTIVDEAEAEGGINALEGELIRSAIEFNDLDISDILTPRVNVVAVSEDATMKEVEKTFVENRFSRLPVYSKSIDSIIGVIHEKDFLAEMHYGREDIKAIVKKVVYVSPSMNISTLLRLLQKEKLHIAIVIDEFGGTEGIVTLEDVLEELVGEIWDEHDEVIEQITRSETDENRILALGDANLEDLFQIVGINTMNMDYDAVTVGGWLIEQMDKIPQTGESILHDNIQFTILEADERMIKQVEILILDQEGEAEEE